MTKIQKITITSKEQFVEKVTRERPARGNLRYEIHDNNEVSCTLDTSGKVIQESMAIVFGGVFEYDDAFRQFLEDNKGVETEGLDKFY